MSSIPHTHSLDYTTLDVFTTTRFGGNPLALILLQETQQPPTQAEKQAIAREFNYSETVFLHLSSASHAAREWTYDIFTTDRELPFAGHPTIGTAWYLAKLYPELIGDVAGTAGSSSARLIAKAGPVELRFARRDGAVYATADIPHNVHVHAHRLQCSDLLKMQPGLAAFSSQQLAESSPVVSIVKGMTFAYIGVGSMEALRAIQLSTMALEQFIELDDGWSPSFTATYFYYVAGDEKSESSGREYRLNCRMIETAFGEDAATGSASAGLAAYLAMEGGRVRGIGGRVEGENMVKISICLLYTSPSPRDGLLSRMPSSA